MLAPIGSDANSLRSEIGFGPTALESSAIVRMIRPVFTDISARYDTKKYWPAVYDRVLTEFRAPKHVSSQTLDEALRWKYGHLGKPGIPEAHRRLISQIQRAWPGVVAELPESPKDAFELLDSRIGGQSRFVTVAFLLHLLFQTHIPIIDQHNFRAVNALMRRVRPTWRSKKKPSRYADIGTVGAFIKSIATAWMDEDETTAPSLRELDKFLMMFGKSIKGAA